MSGIPSWCRKGVAVECIDDVGIFDGDSAYGHERGPMLGLTYTIREALLPDGETPCVLLEEIENPPEIYAFGVHEFMFKASRFRPLISQADDLAAHFDQLLQVPHRIEEKA